MNSASMLFSNEKWLSVSIVSTLLGCTYGEIISSPTCPPPGGLPAIAGVHVPVVVDVLWAVVELAVVGVVVVDVVDEELEVVVAQPLVVVPDVGDSAVVLGTVAVLVTVCVLVVVSLLELELLELVVDELEPVALGRLGYTGCPQQLDVSQLGPDCCASSNVIRIRPSCL